MLIKNIKPGSNHSRAFGEGDVQELADSMRDNGLLQPVLVDEDGNLVAGFRRYAAAVYLGWSDLPAHIVKSDPAINLIENLQRENMNLWDEIQGLERVFGADASYAEVCRRLSKSLTWVKPRIQALSLPQDNLDKVKLGEWNISDVKRALRRKKGQSAASKAMGKPGQLEIADVVTELFGAGREAEARALSYAIGTVTREDLLG